MNRLLMLGVAILVSLAHGAELKILDIAIKDSTVELDFWTDVSEFSVADLCVESKHDLLNDVWRGVSSDLFTERVANVYEGHSVTGKVVFATSPQGVEFYRLHYQDSVSEAINVNINGTLSLNGTNIVEVIEQSAMMQRGCIANLEKSEVHSDADYYGVSRDSMSSYDLSYITIPERKIGRKGTITRVEIQNPSNAVVSLLVATNSVNNTAKILEIHDIVFTGGVANVSIPIDAGSLVGLYQTNKVVRRSVQYNVDGACYYCFGLSPSVGLHVMRWGTNRRLMLDWDLTISYEENVYSGDLAAQLMNRVEKLESLLGISNGGDLNVSGNLLLSGTNIFDAIEMKVVALEKQIGADSMKGQSIVVFGDSLMAGLEFSNRLRELSGANVRTFARGGTYTVPNAAVSVGNGLDRVLEAVETENIAPDVIIYENVNDFAYYNNADRLGSLVDRPWMLSQYIDYDPGFADNAAAAAGFNADFCDIIAGREKLEGTIVRVHYGESTAHGGEGSHKDYYYRYFIGHNAEEFDNIDYWSENPPTLHACYKGMIEYLVSRFPRARIVLLVDPIMASYLGEEKNKNPSYYMYEDGRWNAYNVKRYGQRWVVQEKMATEIESIANLYNLGFVNVFRHCNINIINLDTWYRSNNVHPYAEAYERWAEIVYKYLLYQL